MLVCFNGVSGNSSAEKRKKNALTQEAHYISNTDTHTCSKGPSATHSWLAPPARGILPASELPFAALTVQK